MQTTTPHELIDRALDACSAWNALGSDGRDVERARFVRNASFSDVPGTNRVSHITASTPGEIRDLLALTERTFPDVSALTFEVDHRTPPPFEARLVVDGFAPHDSLVMLLEGDIRGRAPACDVRPIVSDADWRAWEALSTDNNTGYPVRPGVAADRAQAAALTASRRAKCPPLQYFVAYVDGTPAGFFSAWEGIDRVGVVENLFVREDMRSRGIAAALMRACVADARERGAGPVVLTCNPLDWPKTWYARIGFRPGALRRALVRIA
jgi:GNAT superfamily N-acetyltransferase